MLVPLPVIAPGLMVQLPAGRPFNTTLPVAVAQVGCVMTPTVGAVGFAFTVAEVVPGALVQPLTVTVNVYVPLAAIVAFGIVGFCKAEVKPFGPVQE